MTWDGTWNVDEAETFNFNCGSYDVQKAKLILAAKPAREVIQLEVAGYAAMVKMIAELKATNVDLAVPLILVKISDGYLPIDGWNRIAKAINDGVNSLPAVVLTKEERNHVRMT